MDTVSPISPEPDRLAALHAQDAAHLRAMFLELADLGAGIVRMIAQAVNDHADAPAPAAAQIPALSAAYDQTMRSLRRTALLIQKLTAPAPATEPAIPSLDAARKPAARRGGDAPAGVSTLSDAELDRPDRLEGVESGDELARRPLAEIIATILSDFGVAGLYDVDGGLQLTPADIAALYECAAGLAVSRQAGSRAADRVGADAMRPNGAMGCRDP